MVFNSTFNSTRTSKNSTRRSMSSVDEEEESLCLLCEANGFDCDTEAQRAKLANKEVVEMVLDEIYCMAPLKHFENIRMLTLCGVGISRIEGLDRCTQLTKLWLNENHIETLSGLDKCRRLEELYICCNELTTLATHLLGLNDLKVLWVAENNIVSMKGLNFAANLTELNVARNQIASIGGALENNLKLKTLTIAGNKLAKFREVEELTALPNLTQLNFSDPDWGDNPICSLCNYWTYILYHLPYIEVFDKFKISPDALRQAESTYLKKHLYYSMRIKTVQRQAVDAFRWSQNLKNELLQSVEAELEYTAGHLAKLQASAYGSGECPEPSLNSSCEQRTPAERKRHFFTESAPKKSARKDPVEHDYRLRLRKKREELADLRLMWNTFVEDFKKLEGQHTMRLSHELGSGGNVRLELASPCDPRYGTVCDLIRQRFRQNHFDAVGVKNIKIVEMHRIHNRSRRAAFEDLYASMPDAASNLETLFHVPNSSSFRSTDLMSLAENGFQTPTAGLCPVVFTNSVAFADLPRLQQFAFSDQGEAMARAAYAACVHNGESIRPDDIFRKGKVRLPSATILVCSSLVGGACSAKDTPSTFPSLAHGVGRLWSLEPSNNDPRAKINSRDTSPARKTSPSRNAGYSKYSPDAQYRKAREDPVPPAAHYRCFQHDNEVKMWWLWDTKHIIADYAVTIEYETVCNVTNSLSQDVLTTCLKDERKDDVALQLPNVSGKEVNKKDKTSKEKEEKEMEKKEKDTRSKVHAKFGPFCNVIADLSFYALCGKIFFGSKNENLPTPAKAPESIEKLQETHLLDEKLQILEENVRFANVQFLDLRCRGIRKIDSDTFLNLISLQQLLLSFNMLDSLSFLHKNEELTMLDVSYNHLENIDNLKAVPNLAELNVGRNSLLDLECIPLLKEHCKQLTSLTLEGNPALEAHDYRDEVLTGLNQLQKLDGVDITPSHMHLAKSQAALRSDLSEVVWIQSSFVSLRNVRRFRAAPKSQTNSPKRRPSNAAAQDVTSMWMSLGTILGFHDATTKASAQFGGLLRYNDKFEISKQEYIRQGITVNTWRVFTEILDLSGRGISTIPKLQDFNNLKKVNVSKNKLKTLSMFSECPVLEELCADNNEIESLEGIAKLTQLRYLFVGSNKIKDVSDIKNMENLRALSVVDNFIDSLDLFAGVQSLVELYISNNLIESLRSILVLKALPKLIIVDLAGNPLSNESDYHLYAIYHLTRLKVLDGEPVRSSDQTLATSTFGGKLSIERMEEQLGPVSSCYNYRSVDMSSCKLKCLGSLLNDDFFTSLRELSLNDNMVDNVSGVGPLTKLLVLRLNRNRIVSDGLLPINDNTGLSSLNQLQVLELCNNRIDDMEVFGKVDLPQLRVLHLAGNEIDRVAGLTKLKELRELVLDQNKITNIEKESFDGLDSLRELHIVENRLRSLVNFNPLPKLRSLFVTNNRIAEVSELDEISELRNLTSLDFQTNPISRNKPNYRTTAIHFFPNLKSLDGKEITVEEKQRVEFVMSTEWQQQAGNPQSYNNQQSSYVMESGPRYDPRFGPQQGGQQPYPQGDSSQQSSSNNESSGQQTSGNSNTTTSRQSATGSMVVGLQRVSRHNSISSTTSSNSNSTKRSTGNIVRKNSRNSDYGGLPPAPGVQGSNFSVQSGINLPMRERKPPSGRGHGLATGNPSAFPTRNASTSTPRQAQEPMRAFSVNMMGGGMQRRNSQGYK